MGEHRVFVHGLIVRRLMAPESTKYAVYISLFYNVVGMLPFLMPDTIKDLIPGIKTEDCPRRNKCVEHVDFTSAKIYLQVIVGVAVMYACLIGIDNRKNGLLAALGCFIFTMGKHIVVDGLIPPPPVMVMTAITLAADGAQRHLSVYRCWLRCSEERHLVLGGDRPLQRHVGHFRRDAEPRPRPRLLVDGRPPRARQACHPRQVWPAGLHDRPQLCRRRRRLV